MLKPFRVTNVTDTNSAAWITNIKAPASGIQIVWPPDGAFSLGGSLVFMGAVTDVDYAGAADIESRVEGAFTITPKGQPYSAAAAS